MPTPCIARHIVEAGVAGTPQVSFHLRFICPRRPACPCIIKVRGYSVGALYELQPVPDPIPTA